MKTVILVASNGKGDEIWVREYDDGFEMFAEKDCIAYLGDLDSIKDCKVYAKEYFHDLTL